MYIYFTFFIFKKIKKKIIFFVYNKIKRKSYNKKKYKIYYKNIFHIKKIYWLRGLDLNQGPSGYEPDELPDCSTPRFLWFLSKDLKV